MLSVDMELQPSELSEVDGSVDDTVDLGPGDQQHGKAQEFKNIGNEKFQKGNYKGAIIDYKKGLLHEPNNSDLHANLSAAYIHLEKFVEAEEHALYAVHLKPDYYKGYLRAAKAAHGKGLTRLGIKRLNTGLAAVTDSNGVKELTRLRNQYTCYMSLQSNAEREMDIDYDRYESEDDIDDIDLSDFDDGSDDDPPEPDYDPPEPDYDPPEQDVYVDVESIDNEPMTPKTNSIPATTTEQATVTTKVDSCKSKAAKQPPSKEELTIAAPTKVEDSCKSKAAEQPPSKEKLTIAAPTKVEDSCKSKAAEQPPSKEKLTIAAPTKVEDSCKSKAAEQLPSKEKLTIATPPVPVENTKATDLPQPNPVEKDLPIEKREEKPENKFLELCKELTKDPHLKKHIAEFKEHIRAGSEAYLSGNYRKAADSYKAAKERVGVKLSDYEIEDRQYHIIIYAYCASLISIGTYEDIVKAIQCLDEMEVYEFSIPALHILKARAYYKLNRFRNALQLLEHAREILDNYLIFPTFTWPGSNETIQETTPTGLKSAIKELEQMCKVPHKPTAVCRFDNCLKTGTHILPSDLIYDSDPDFIGYVRMICQGKCHIEFHILCWKSYKESVCGIGKISDKDILGRRCVTTDCVNSEGEPSVVIIIEIIDSDGQVKFVNKLDPKAAVDGKKVNKKKKCKLDDRDKAPKPKKVKEKKVREVIKKPVAVPEGEEEPDPVAATVYSEKILQSRLQSLSELREINFGMGDQYWNPKLPFYGRLSESMNANGGYIHDTTNDESIAVKDAKEFLYSYFMAILKDEGPLKQLEVEDLWKDSAGDFCDITVVLPNLKSMCELLTESNNFCQLEDYICLAEQLDEAYEMVKTEISGVVSFLMTGSTVAGNDSKQNSAAPSRLSDGLPDLLNHPQSTNSQATISPSSSEEDLESPEYNSGELEFPEYNSGELEFQEYNSGEESEEFSDEDSFEEEDADFVVETPNVVIVPDEDVVVMPEIKPPDEGGKFSLQEMLNEMTRVKNIFMNTSSETAETSLSPGELEASKDKGESNNTHETFETAHGSSVNATDDTKKNAFTVPENLNENEREREICHNEDVVIVDSDNETSLIVDEIGELMEALKIEDTVQISETTTSTDHAEINQDSIINGEHEPCQRAASTEKEQAQMSSTKTTEEELSQKMAYDQRYEQLNRMVEELSRNLYTLRENNDRLTKDIADKEASYELLKAVHKKAIADLQEENNKAMEAQKALNENLKAGLQKTKADFKKKEDDLVANMNKMKDMYGKLLLDNTTLKKDISSLTNDAKILGEGLNTAKANIKDFEGKLKASEEKMTAKLKKAEVAHLSTIKVYWESQINLLKKHCVEKISEMHRWFSMFPSEEVEDLPSWELIRQNIMQWKDVSMQVQQIETSFQAKYNDFEAKIQRGENIEELDQLQLPTLPDEPTPLPLDQIHKEITEKQRKMINELNQLVASQQLEIEKSKETNQQFQQLMSTHQMVPRVNSQTPMATAFGNLALLQYTYPQTLPALYGQTPVPTIPPPGQNSAKVGDIPTLLQTNVQTLLQESSKNTLFTKSPSVNSSINDAEAASISRGPTPPASATYPYLSNTPISLPSSPLIYPSATLSLSSAVKDPKISLPPPPMGVAQSLLKNSAPFMDKKDLKSAGRSITTITPGQESSKTESSRESTPAPTPEKTKKKKKTKSESKDSVDAKLAASANTSADNESSKQDDPSSWNIVLPRSAIPKHPAPPPAPVGNWSADKCCVEVSYTSPSTKNEIIPFRSEAKFKNKKKLLDKLQLKFSTSSLKDLDDLVKLVREQNNGSLSGLPFDEIETRVERLITKKQFQKSSTMGLDKFSKAAWGPVKQQENITWTSLHLEECTICLDPMGNDRTRVDCNHEFHTECLRAWLKEKSTCPLCNKFTTMPDEFPAL